MKVNDGMIISSHKRESKKERGKLSLLARVRLDRYGKKPWENNGFV